MAEGLDPDGLRVELAGFRRRRQQRYASVNALLLWWKDDDIGCSAEVKALGTVLRDHFNFVTWPFEIPSQDAQRRLNLHMANFVGRFGGDDNLIIVYYGGHGDKTASGKSPCTWSALTTGGPTIDWSLIQPSLLGAGCDVVILLDCCFAGQAVRGHGSHTVEFLAATDKDQFTPTGKKTWPSFTKVLTEQMALLAVHGGFTLTQLQKRLLDADLGLVRQPFYVKLSEFGEASSIVIQKWQEISGDAISGTIVVEEDKSSEAHSLLLRVAVRDSFDLADGKSLLRWLTTHSPRSITDIEVMKSVIIEASHISQAEKLIAPEATENRSPTLPILSESARNEAAKLFQDLNSAFRKAQVLQFTETEAVAIINDIKQQTDNLFLLIGDSLAKLDANALHSLMCLKASEIEHLKTRISMRLKLIEDAPLETARVIFEESDDGNVQFKFGKHRGELVLVEYFYHEASVEAEEKRLWQQAAKMSAVQAEPKDVSFRCLLGCGFLHETLHRRRFGFLHAVPSAHVGDACLTLFEAIHEVKHVPLDSRYRLAADLCEALLNFHGIGWFHKSVKNSHILFFANPAIPGTKREYQDVYIEEPYFVGFNCSRPEDAETWTAVDYSLSDNLYRHPDRWGRATRFKQHHDIYALGILLMEIGFWKPLPQLDPKRQEFQHIRDPERLRDHLLQLSSKKLSHYAGTSFAGAVSFCLDSEAWRDLEVWQYQRLVRNQVWRPLSAGVRT